MAYSAAAVANFFIQKSLDTKQPATDMRIQKLVYFAHAIRYATTDQLLVLEPFVAWPHGPAVVSLYTELKSYVAEPITERISTLGVEDDQICVAYPEVPRGDTSTWDFLDRVWANLRKYDTWQLRCISHAPGGAWYKTVTEYFSRPDTPNNVNIDDTESLCRHLPRNLTILDPVIKECGR